MSSRIRLLVASALLSPLFGCWSFVASPPGYQEPIGTGSSREAVLLVSDAGVPFTDGSLGSEIVKALASSKAQGPIYYPVVPVSPPPLVIRVRAIGEYEESYVLGVVSSIATGYFLFLPAPFMPYLQWYSARCHVEVIDGGRQIAAFQVESDTRYVFHAIFADARDYRVKVKDSVLRDLANGIARQLAGLPLQSARPGGQQLAEPPS